MSLTAGQRLGPYEVVGPLGAGGMGEVFLARDTRLGREVALKVIPREFASSPDRRARFEREARAISALSHPHVCALYDVGHTDAADGVIEYLVMERLEGETLAARLKRGPLPVPEVLVLGGQLAGALDAAHRRGFVHRDLKPANVMLTRAGAKLLDFGLARRDDDGGEAAPRADAAATLTTQDGPLTREGALVGTWPYLAPEQLRGRPADARSDLFALGCVLFEALTGRRAFPGTTQAEVTAAILASEPHDLLRAQEPAVPPALGALVRGCLAKDPDGRWQCAHDVARGLRLVEEGLARPVTEPRAVRPVARWALSLGLLGIAAAAVTALVLARRPVVQPLRFTVAPPAGVLLHRPTASHPLAVSPDGRRVVFTAMSGGVSGLWLWSAEDGRARPLEPAVGGVAPFFSPDGREVAYFAGDDLKRMSVDGGPATTIARGALGNSGTWGPDGTILYARRTAPSGLFVVPAGGGAARSLAAAASPRELRAFPRFLPDGRHYLFRTSDSSLAERQLCVASLAGGKPDCFTSCHSQGEYSGSGHILCVRAGTLVALPFDARSRSLTGHEITLARDVRWYGPPGSAAFAVSADGGTLVYEPRPAPSRLIWLDRNGREAGMLGEPAAHGWVQISPDGRRVAVDIWHADGSGRDIWALDAGSGVSTRLTFNPVDAWGPAWSPDGTRLAFAKPGGGLYPDVSVLHLDGSAREEVLLPADGVQIPRHWSPDGRLIAYDDSLPGRQPQRQLWLLSVSDGRTRRVTSAPASTYQGRFSPDGRTLAYVSEESARPEVYLVDLGGRSPARRVSRAGGVLPRFRGDGAELFFFQPDGMMMTVDPADEAATPRSLFHIEGVTAFDFDFDVTRDGQRFLARHAPEAEGAAGLNVVIGWSRRLGEPEPEAR